MWVKFVNLFKVSWVFGSNYMGVVESWVLSKLSTRKKVAWVTVPAAILWTMEREKCENL